jgi:hypothetical protein
MAVLDDHILVIDEGSGDRDSLCHRLDRCGRHREAQAEQKKARDG